MKKLMKHLITFIGLGMLGMGMASAAPSLDCGDDDAQPISVHSAAKVVIKDS